MQSATIGQGSADEWLWKVPDKWKQWGLVHTNEPMMVGMCFATKIQTRFCFETRQIEWLSWNLSSLKTRTLPSVNRDDALPHYPFVLYFELLQLDHCERGNQVVVIVLLWDLLRWILEAELPLWLWQSGLKQVRFIVWSMSNLVKSRRVCIN